MKEFSTPDSPRTTALPRREEMPFSSVRLGKSWRYVLWGTGGEVLFGIHLLRRLLGKGKPLCCIPNELSPWIWPQFISDWGVKVTPWCPMCFHAHDGLQWPTTLGLGTWVWERLCSSCVTPVSWVPGLRGLHNFHLSQVFSDKSLQTIIFEI